MELRSPMELVGRGRVRLALVSSRRQLMEEEGVEEFAVAVMALLEEEEAVSFLPDLRRVRISTVVDITLEVWGERHALECTPL